jgi:beta-glucuronidase
VAAALEVQRKDDVVLIDDPLGENIDLTSFKEYAGWYFGSLKEMANYTFKIKYNKSVVITEFGADALGGFHSDTNARWSEEYQEEFYKNQLKMFGTIPGLSGMTPWILVDFQSPRRPHPYYQNFWNRKGLLTETGKKKKAYFVLKNFYDGMQKIK